jgi:hypothetical protein
MPVQLKGMSPKNNKIILSSMAWNPAREFNEKANDFIPNLKTPEERQPNADGKNIFGLAMPVIKPGFPEDNTAFTMNLSTMAIVQGEMLEGNLITSAKL